MTLLLSDTKRLLKNRASKWSWILACFAVPATVLAQGSVSFSSPSGDLQSTLSLDKGRLTVGLKRGNAVLTEPSPLGIVVNGKDRGNELSSLSLGEAKVAR